MCFRAYLRGLTRGRAVKFRCVHTQVHKSGKARITAEASTTVHTCSNPLSRRSQPCPQRQHYGGDAQTPAYGAST